MTIGIAILCDDGRSVVIASDRMLSHDFSPPDSFHFLHIDADCDKLQGFGGHSFLMFSGDAPVGQTAHQSRRGVDKDS